MGLSQCRLMVIQFDVLVVGFGNSHEECRIIVTRSIRVFLKLNQHFFDLNFEHILILLMDHSIDRYVEEWEKILWRMGQ